MIKINNKEKKYMFMVYFACLIQQHYNSGPPVI